MPRPKSVAPKDSTATIGFEAKLWLTDDKLRNNMDAADYSRAERDRLLKAARRVRAAAPINHVVLGLIFLKYISDTFEEHRAKLLAGEGDYVGANPEDPDEPSGARQPAAGSPKGERGGVHQFYTPSCVVRCLVEMLAPYTALRGSAFLQSEASPQVVSAAKDNGRIYDPACGSGGMFVQSEKFVESHGGKLGDISIYGQESNATTRRLAVMNLALRGIEADIGPEHADTFRRDLHPDLRADYILANPPFNDSDWFRKDDDVRWQFGVPPKGNANFAWVQHFIHHLAPQGMAGFVLANGSMSSNQSGECVARSASSKPEAKLHGLGRQRDIRRALIEADLVDCMVALPGQLFYSTQPIEALAA